MFSRLNISQEYELVDQLANRSNVEGQFEITTDVESGAEEDGVVTAGSSSYSSKNSQDSDSDSSTVFDDIDAAAANSKDGNDDFNEDPDFQTIWFGYKHARGPGVIWGMSRKRICFLTMAGSIVIWFLALFVYSKDSHQQIIDKLGKPNTNIVHTLSGNITINPYHHSSKNITMDTFFKAELVSSQVPITWLETSQYPTTGTGGGYFATSTKKAFTVIKQLDTAYEKALIVEPKFAYQNNFFNIAQVILNPAKPVDQINDNWHIVVTDSSAQWRHLMFALYWVYNPLTNQYSPIQPPDLATDKKSPTSLFKLHFVKFSPNGDKIVFGFNHDLYIQDFQNGTLTRVTTNGSNDIFNGKTDWIYEEEVLGTSDMVWWSPDQSRLIYVTLNNTEVAEIELDYYIKGTKEIFTNFEEPSSGSTIGDIHQYGVKTAVKYPKPGSANPLPTVNRYNLVDKSTTKIDIKDDSGHLGNDFIFYSGQWIDNDSFIMKLTDRTSRYFSKRLVKDSQTIPISDIDNKLTNTWTTQQIPLAIISSLGKSVGYVDTIISHNRTQLAFFETPDATEPTIIGEPGWSFLDEYSITYNAIDECIYFLSSKKSTMDAHLVFVNLKDTTTVREVTSTEINGKYTTHFSRDGQYLLLLYMGPDTPWQKLMNMAEVHEWLDAHPEATSGNGFIKEIQPINNAVQLTKSLSDRNLPTRIHRQIKLKENGMLLNMVEILPPNFNPQKYKYPILVNTYSGPGSQLADQSFSIGFEDVVSASLNAIILIIDPRGTGPNWESRSFSSGKLGYWEPRDILTITKDYLEVNKDFVDPKSVAIWGWSYGGYTTLKTLELDGGKTFKYGMAVAPVTNWLFYDSIYVEKYLSLPANNEQEYLSDSAVNNVKAIGQSNRFLLVQGTSDDNVHIQNLYWLLDKLDSAEIENYDLVIFPDNDHSLRYHKATQVVYTRLHQWLKDAFAGKFA